MAQRTETADPAPLPARTRYTRLGLFLPSILLIAVALIWTAAWFWIRDRAAGEMDGWLAGEAAAGRTWTCADRSIAGYPFRIELRCASLSFVRSDSRFTLGPLTVLVQVYQPRHGLLQVSGPFRVEQGDLKADATWTSLQASFHGASDGFVRASLAVDGVKGNIIGAAPDPVAFAAEHLEFHARPAPGRFATEGAVDVSLRLARALVPLIDPLVGNADPADVAVDATVNQAAGLRTGRVAEELDEWRRAGGGIDIALLSLVKGERKIQARGNLALDDGHRPAGQLDVRAAGLEVVIAQAMGQRFGADRGAMIGNLVGQLLGGARRPPNPAETEAPGDPALKPLPPLRLADGRLLLGPIPIPNVRLPALY